VSYIISDSDLNQIHESDSTDEAVEAFMVYALSQMLDKPEDHLVTAESETPNGSPMVVALHVEEQRPLAYLFNMPADTLRAALERTGLKGSSEQ
jgi:hypothetical protein